jgi:hypothetical protein
MLDWLSKADNVGTVLGVSDRIDLYSLLSRGYDGKIGFTRRNVGTGDRENGILDGDAYRRSATHA